MAPLAELLRRAVALLIGLVVLGVAIVFASLFFALFATLALTIGGWFWWRTRGLRRRAAQEGRVVIEGQYRVERETERLDRRA